MSGPITNFADLISRWNSVGDFAGDIGVDRKHAHGMRFRRSVPPYYWAKVVEAAEKRGYQEITHELLVRLGGRPRQRLRRPTRQEAPTNP